MADELSKRTVRELRELARTHLGKGHSGLKTKDELVLALRKAMVPPQPPAPTRATTVENGNSNGKAAAAHVQENFFVRPSAQPPPKLPSQRLEELRPTYSDDAELLLPRDPHTLFFLWDYSGTTVAAAKAGMEWPRARLRVLEGDRVVREIDISLETRSHYIDGLTAGRTYRVEAFFQDARGHHQRIGKGSVAVSLPPDGPSPELGAQPMRVPWELPLSQIKRMSPDQLFPQQLELPGRVPLPGSQTSRPPSLSQSLKPTSPTAGSRPRLPTSSGKP